MYNHVHVIITHKAYRCLIGSSLLLGRKLQASCTVYNHMYILLGALTWVGEIEREAETTFHDKRKDTRRQIEGNDVLGLWTK